MPIISGPSGSPWRLPRPRRYEAVSRGPSVAGSRSVRATLSTAQSEATPLTLSLDMALAGVAACGFGAFYNAPWRVLWVSILCGMVGHGLRYVGHLGMSMSTLFGCLAIGLIANTAAIRMRLPFSALAFAGAVRPACGPDLPPQLNQPPSRPRKPASRMCLVDWWTAVLPQSWWQFVSP
jgi:hypothetical protein